MKNDALYTHLNGIDKNDPVLKALMHIEQKLENEISAKQDLIEWQRCEQKRLISKITEKDITISELNAELADCRSNVEGNRQLINKLITDIDRLQQNIDWYKRTYESRSLLGVIKDKLKHLFT